jgi:hypothetical protein
MSETKKEEIIRLLSKTIEAEKNKVSGGNSKTIEELSSKLQSIIEGKNKGIKSRK